MDEKNQTSTSPAPRTDGKTADRRNFRGGRGGQRMMRRPMRSPSKTADKKKPDEIPPIGDSIRIIPLGGVEEIGKNMTAIEYGNDIIVIDCGFQFKEEDTPGIDYILPNTKYLEERKEKIKAMNERIFGFLQWLNSICSGPFLHELECAIPDEGRDILDPNTLGDVERKVAYVEFLFFAPLTS